MHPVTSYDAAYMANYMISLQWSVPVEPWLAAELVV